MPILDNWIESPLSFIEECVGTSGKVQVSKVKEYFGNRLQDLKDLNQIPSISEVPIGEIKPNSLVRCRCMVQDQFDPEYYLGHYESYNRETREKKLRIGMFRDTSDCEKGEEILYESTSNETLERQSLYCVPVPGENEWAINEFKSKSSCKSRNAVDRTKRQRDEDMNEDIGDSEKMDMQSGTVHGGDNIKRCRQEQNGSSSTSGTSRDEMQTEFNPNYPLPHENRTSYLIIMYDNDDCPKLNEVYEFIGIMTCDPELAGVTMGNHNTKDDNVDDMMTAEERFAHCPPSSLVPRIHCILARKLLHTNPLVPSVACEMEDNADIATVRNELAEIRDTVVNLLTKILYGDKLAAEYVLLNMISRVYGRVEPMALGKFSLNLTKCPAASEPTSLALPSEISKFLEFTTTKSHLIPLTISNLNKSTFIPKKDYCANRLASGLLQLSEGTHLILDETVLEPGQLDTNGVQNVTAIGNVVQWQKVEYDFKYHKCDMKTDLTVLILSEARSLVQCDCIVPLCKETTTPHNASLLLLSVAPELVNKIRIYLEIARSMDFNLSDQMQEVIKEDYVGMREADAKNMNPEAFHLLLVMARLVSISFGKNVLTPDLWKKTKELEVERNARLSCL